MTLSGLDTDLGDLTLEDRLAMGGMAEIFTAAPHDPAQFGGQSRVIVKRLMARFRAEPEFVKLFTTEAKLCVKLKHPHIVRTYRAFKKDLDWYMVQEWVDGGSLGFVTGRLKSGGLRIPPAGTVAVMIGLLKALGYVHKARLGDQHVRLVHRDVNPGNLLCSVDGEVKLTDFGVAEGEGVGAARVEGVLRGTPAYMAPEQVAGEMVDPRTDLFSAGIVMWELLTGRELFAAESDFEVLRKVKEHGAAPPSVYADIPESLDAVCLKALEKDPDARFQSSTDFGRALVSAAKGAGLGSGDTQVLAAAVRHARELKPRLPEV
ncbi:MAG: serine/threonine-protein kinase [Deltaproteobacteria bacterium]|nr:serine/threonine-protein kinase [Deltaproteobacteria bacterium]